MIINFMIRGNCSESYNEFLDSYFFNLRKCLFRNFGTVTPETLLKKKATIHGLSILLAACAN